MQLRFKTRSRPTFSPPAVPDTGITSLSILKILKALWIPILIILVTLLIYWPVRLSGFVSDDFLNHVHFKWGWTEYSYWISKLRAHEIKYPFFRPVVWATYKLDYIFWGANPVPMHIVNIVLHAVNAVLIYLLSLRLGLRHLGATVCALFFALYPAHPEAVTWLAGRYDVLSGTFVMLMAIFWCEARLKTDSRYMIPSLIAFFLAIHSKEVAYAAILTLPILDWVLNSRTKREYGHAGGGVGWRWKWYIVFFAVFLCSVGFRFWLYNSLGGYTDEHNQSAYLSAGFTEIYSNLVAGDLLMLFTPISRILWTGWSTSLKAIFSISGILLLAGILFSVVRSAIEARNTSDIKLVGIVAAVIWILIFLAPVITVNGVKSSLDYSRFLYIPAFGLAFLIGTTADRLPRLAIPWSVILALVLLMSLGLSGYALTKHNGTWLEAGRISSRLATIMDNGTSSLPDNSVVYLINFPWLWKGAHCAPVDYGGWLEFKYGIPGTDTIELGTVSNPYDWGVNNNVHTWWNESSWNYHAVGFIWEPSTHDVEFLPLKNPRDIDTSLVTEFLGTEIPPPEVTVFPE